MNTRIKGIVILLTFALLAGALCVISYAKDMEECYHCGRTGKFQCPTCGNAGEVVCDGCGGTGRWICDGEEGKGKCDNGYYVCPSCDGDGLSRPIPADGNAGPCGQCGGSGRIECWKCHGSGGGVCDRCGGSGKNECQNGNCKEARKIGWKCPYCKGTGYLGDGPDFPPEWNDGVHNVPQAGDHIITDHSTWQGYYYSPDGNHVPDNAGGSSGSGNNGSSGADNGGNSGASDPSKDPVTGRDYIWYVDLGDGVWNIGGKTVRVMRNGSPVSGVADLKYSEQLLLEGLEGEPNVHVYLCGENDFRVELIMSGDCEVAVGRHLPEEAIVPENVRLEVAKESGGDNPDNPDNPGNPDNPVEARKIDFGAGSWHVDGKTVRAYADGKELKGEIELELSEVIKLENFESDKMTVRLYADDGFSVTLTANGDNEVSIGRYEPIECVLSADLLHFTVEEKQNDEGFESEGGDGAGRDKEPVHASGEEASEENKEFPILLIVIPALCAAGAAAFFIIKKRRTKKGTEITG